MFDPVLRAEVWTGPRPGPFERPERGGFDVRLMELVPPIYKPRFVASTPPRPAHFRLAALKRGDNDWTAGRTLTFKEGTRIFYVGVTLGRDVPSATRRDIERMLDSLVVGG